MLNDLIVFLVHTTKLHSPNLGRYLYYSIATVIRAALLLLDYTRLRSLTASQRPQFLPAPSHLRGFRRLSSLKFQIAGRGPVFISRRQARARRNPATLGKLMQSNPVSNPVTYLIGTGLLRRFRP